MIFGMTLASLPLSKTKAAMKNLVFASVLAPVVALTLAAEARAQTTLNVRDADIRAFIADAAKVTGRTFIIDNRVSGKVTVVTDRPLSRSEYFEVFLSTLRANGLVAVPTSNGAFRVQPLDNAASQPSRIGVAGAARNSYVTEIIRLRATDAASAVDTVRPLVSAQGSVTANRGGNSLVVVDFADNIRRHCCHLVDARRRAQECERARHRDRAAGPDRHRRGPGRRAGRRRGIGTDRIGGRGRGIECGRAAR
jgi:general secretion pathway protein D